MKEILNKAIKTKRISKSDLEKLLDFVNQPENKSDYYISSESKKDRIGNYREFFLNPTDKENQKKYKIYELNDQRDIVNYRLQYYDILRDESTSFLKKSMLLYTLQKRIEYIFKNVLRDSQVTNFSKEVRELLDKVKNARSYYTYKVFLDNNSSEKKRKNSNDSVSRVVKKK